MLPCSSLAVAGASLLQKTWNTCQCWSDPGRPLGRQGILFISCQEPSDDSLLSHTITKESRACTLTGQWHTTAISVIPFRMGRRGRAAWPFRDQASSPCGLSFSCWLSAGMNWNDPKKNHRRDGFSFVGIPFLFIPNTRKVIP